MVAGRRRGGKPRIKAERRIRHKSKYGSDTVPPRGRGIFCRRLESMIGEEATAQTDYDRLMTYAPTGSKTAIKGIQRDERGHRKKLIGLRDRYCR